MTPEEQVLYFADNYDIIAKHHLIGTTPKVFLGSKDGRVCRYCGKSEGEVPFKITAHAIPEFTGNKTLIDYEECDLCNQLFSRVVEDHLANYLGAFRTVAQLHGKKGVPTHVSNDGKSRISMEKTGMQMTSYDEDPIFDLDLESKKMTIKAFRKPYVKMAAFKCLAKMALAIMPREDLKDCQHLVEWIRKETHTFESFPYKPLNALVQFTPGPAPYKGVHLFLLKRRTAEKPMPYMYFIVAFANTLFQLVLPMPFKDKEFMGKPMNLAFFPVPFDETHKYGPTTRKDIDFSSPEVTRDEYQPIVMGFERVEATEATLTP